MSAELAARCTAAAAVLADFKRETDAGLDDPAKATPRPDYSMWAWRLSSELGSVLQRLEAEAAETPADPAAAQLTDIRLVLEAFDWETDDRQYALEQIGDIVSRGVQDHVCPEGTWHFSDHGEIYAAHPDGTAHVVGGRDER